MQAGAVAKWEEEYDERNDPRHRYFWLTGKFVNYDQGVMIQMSGPWTMVMFLWKVPVRPDRSSRHFHFFSKELGSASNTSESHSGRSVKDLG